MSIFGCCCEYGEKDATNPNDPNNNAFKLQHKDAARSLSHVGKAVYGVLHTKHLSHQQNLWNVTKSEMVGSLLQTPMGKSFWESPEDPPEGHSHWFADKMCEILSKTTRWCDMTTLWAPDDYFLKQFKKGLKNICETSQDTRYTDKPIIIRFMHGNIIGKPLNANKFIKELTKDLPKGANIQIWVGAWRAGLSWNHSKFIAVDGRYILQGGHNQATGRYLLENPVHDLSLEMEGHVAHDAHLFANGQWEFIEKKQDTWAGQILEKIPDWQILVSKKRIIVSEYPEGVANEFAPYYNCSLVPIYTSPSDSVPVISVGRHGALIKHARPADDAITAMIDSSNNIIRMSQQDFGPLCFPGTQIPLPGTGWPDQHLNALARAIWSRGVDIEIVISNLHDGYSNGWSCSIVGSQIIKRIESQFPSADDSKIRQLVEENLRICYIKHAKNPSFGNGIGVANHAKYFIVDDICSYTGSQNIYVCDLAEWGLIIDDSAVTAQMIQDYWKPLWEASFVETDCDVQEIMDGLHINREGVYIDVSTEAGRRKIDEAAAALSRQRLPLHTDMYDEDKDELLGLTKVQIT